MSFLGIDVTGLNELEHDLVKAGATIGLRVTPVVQRGAGNIQRDARENAPQGPRTRAYPHSITFDMTFDGGVGAEIGPDKDLPQGPLGNIFEYGTSTQAPHPHLGPALDREAPNFEHWLAEVAGHI